MQNVEGNMLVDMLASIVAYPFVALQVHDEAEAGMVDSEMRNSDEDPGNGGGPGKTPAQV